MWKINLHHVFSLLFFRGPSIAYSQGEQQERRYLTQDKVGWRKCHWWKKSGLSRQPITGHRVIQSKFGVFVGGGGGVYSFRRNWITDLMKSLGSVSPTSKESIYREIMSLLEKNCFLFVCSVDYLWIYCKTLAKWYYGFTRYMSI